MADHEIDDYWWCVLERRENNMTKGSLTNCTIRFEQACFHPFYHFIKGEELKRPKDR